MPSDTSPTSVQPGDRASITLDATVIESNGDGTCRIDAAGIEMTVFEADLQ